VNPETGGDCLNTIAFAALSLRPGEEIALPRISAARVFHVIGGRGDATVDATSIAFEQADTFCAPGSPAVRLANRSSRAPLYLVLADESPLQRKLGVLRRALTKESTRHP
jgi:gentisate 1,2-dioxygenase